MTARFLRYIEKVFGWSGMMERVRDSRQKPQIPGAAILTGVLLMFATRLGSLNALGGQLRTPGRWLRVLGSRLPSADTVARVAEKFDTECLRDFLSDALHRLRRMKVLADNPWALRFLVLDGHEFFSQ
jgi:hypothetical protein